MLKRNKPLRRTRLNPVSKKRKADMATYAKLRKTFLAAHPVCQVWLKEHGFAEVGNGLYKKMGVEIPAAWLLNRGAQASTEVHHKERRGKNYLRTETWLAVSSANHKRIEGQSTYDGLPYGMSWARHEGWLA